MSLVVKRMKLNDVTASCATPMGKIARPKQGGEPGHSIVKSI